MNPIVTIAGGVLVASMAFGVGYWRGHTAGTQEVQQQWDHEKTEQLAAYARQQELTREKEQSWQQAADNIRQEKDREIRNLNARATALVNSLRDRPTRPTESSTVPGATSSGQSGCTGKELYREDGEFLVRLAREADELRQALKQCYKQYESIRNTP